MNKYILLVLASLTTFAACKKSDNKTTILSNVVTIDGTSYNTVVIGSQTWTASNYDGPGGALNPNENEATFGKLYQLSEIKKIALPAGWHIPTMADIITLLKSQGTLTNNFLGQLILDTIGARHLRSPADGWGIPGDDKSGFDALPAGFFNAYLNIFPNRNAQATFWSSTPGINKLDTPSQCVMVLSGFPTHNGGLPVEGAAADSTKGVLNSGFSLRFVKDN